jgi:hypothetical protein
MDNEEKTTPLSGCLFRTFWILLGPAVLSLCAIIIAANQVGLLGILDIFYVVILILTVVARLVDKPQPEFSYSNPPVVTSQMEEKHNANRRAVRLYITIFPAASIVLWLLAHFVLKRLF